jgi:hypothetical protein
MEFEWDKKNFQGFAVICRKPHVASSICLRGTIFQNPEWTLWRLYVCLVIMEFEWDKKKLPEFRCNLPQTACGWLNLFARHNFSKPRLDFVDTLYVCLVIMEFEWDQKNFQSFAVICRKPHVSSSICLRATIFQNPEWTLWILYNYPRHYSLLCERFNY